LACDGNCMHGISFAALRMGTYVPIRVATFPEIKRKTVGEVHRHSDSFACGGLRVVIDPVEFA
jgi:hypothetical protein